MRIFAEDNGRRVTAATTLSQRTVTTRREPVVTMRANRHQH